MQAIDEASWISIQQDVRRTYVAMFEALSERRFEAATACLERLAAMAGFDQDHPHVMLFRTIIAIQQGQARDALHTLNALGEDFRPELRALCLYSLQDPLWEGLAESLAESPDEQVSGAMRQLLDRYRAVVAAM